MLMTTLLIFGSLAQAVSPLTQAQQTQIATAGDFNSRFDEAALYALMNNALRWQDGDETGAMIPDRKALYQSPAQSRGQLFLIEGKFAGGPRLIGNLTRLGPWDEKLQEWVIVTDRQKDEVAVVYLVDPPRPIDQPLPAGTPIRLVARFYKVLSDKDRLGKPIDYLIFVGKSARTVEQEGGSATSGVTPLMLVVMLLAIVWFLARRAVKVRPLSTRVQRQRHTPTSQGSQSRRETQGLSGDQESRVLSEDPVEALRLLEMQHDESS